MVYRLKVLRVCCALLNMNVANDLSSVSTIADGIAVKEPGEHTFDLCSKYVDGIVTVTEDEICAAILALMEQQKLIAEGRGQLLWQLLCSIRFRWQGRKQFAWYPEEILM